MNIPIDHLDQLAAQARSEDEALPAAESAGQRMDLWVPTEAVQMFELELPALQGRKLQEMLPWLLEERLLSPPDIFECILGPPTGSQQWLVYVVEKAQIARWLSISSASGIAPQRMAPDFLALPLEEGRWTLYTEKGRLLVRTGQFSGFAAPLDIGWQQLELLLAREEQMPGLSHLDATDTGLQIPEFFRDRLDTQHGRINWTFSELPVDVNILPVHCTPRAGRPWMVWVPSLAAAAVLCVAGLTYLSAQSWTWEQEIEILEAGVARAYQELFGEDLGSATENAVVRGQAHLEMLQHQYLVTRASPLAELAALDRILSTCSSCSLMKISQTEQGTVLKLRYTEQIRARTAGLAGWDLDWSEPDEHDYSSLTIQRAAP